MSNNIRELLKGKGLLAELEDCRNEEEAINVLKRENLWGIINYTELEELKESYKNGEIEADGTLSLSQLDKVAGGGKGKIAKPKGTNVSKIVNVLERKRRQFTIGQQGELVENPNADHENSDDVEKLEKELEFKIKESPARETSTDEENKQISNTIGEETVIPVEEVEPEKPAEPPMLPEVLLNFVKSYAETHKNAPEMEKTEESHVDSHVENEIIPNEDGDIEVKKQAEENSENEQEQERQAPAEEPPVTQELENEQEPVKNNNKEVKEESPAEDEKTTERPVHDAEGIEEAPVENEQEEALKPQKERKDSDVDTSSGSGNDVTQEPSFSDCFNSSILSVGSPYDIGSRVQIPEEQQAEVVNIPEEQQAEVVKIFERPVENEYVESGENIIIEIDDLMQGNEGWTTNALQFIKYTISNSNFDPNVCNYYKTFVYINCIDSLTRNILDPKEALNIIVKATVNAQTPSEIFELQHAVTNFLEKSAIKAKENPYINQIAHIKDYLLVNFKSCEHLKKLNKMYDDFKQNETEDKTELFQFTIERYICNLVNNNKNYLEQFQEIIVSAVANVLSVAYILSKENYCNFEHSIQAALNVIKPFVDKNEPNIYYDVTSERVCVSSGRVNRIPLDGLPISYQKESIEDLNSFIVKIVDRLTITENDKDKVKNIFAFKNLQDTQKLKNGANDYLTQRLKDGEITDSELCCVLPGNTLNGSNIASLKQIFKDSNRYDHIDKETKNTYNGFLPYAIAKFFRTSAYKEAFTRAVEKTTNASSKQFRDFSQTQLKLLTRSEEDWPNDRATFIKNTEATFSSEGQNVNKTIRFNKCFKALAYNRLSAEEARNVITRAAINAQTFTEWKMLNEQTKKFSELLPDIAEYIKKFSEMLEKHSNFNRQYLDTLPPNQRDIWNQLKENKDDIKSDIAQHLTELYFRDSYIKVSAINLLNIRQLNSDYTDNVTKDKVMSSVAFVIDCSFRLYMNNPKFFVQAVRGALNYLKEYAENGKYLFYDYMTDRYYFSRESINEIRDGQVKEIQIGTTICFDSILEELIGLLPTNYKGHVIQISESLKTS